MDKLTMGDRIREARKHKGFTQEQVAELLDISVESVSHIERGTRLPSMQVFVKLIEVLNVSADYLLRDSISTGRLFGDNALGSKIEQLSPKERIALEALVDTYLQHHI
ncbi:MAG: helix-turn-helix transcriptional regulator [Clostridia bacterium]|nr:helix-turn-helix transcriptional regulator [Clostridia bacterium]